MRNIKYLLFTILVCLFAIPNVFAKGVVEIKSIELDSKSENATINSEPTFNGLKMDFDVSFKEKNDFVKYKVLIKNDTDIDYKISNDTSFNTSEYITYTYEVGSELKAGSEVAVYVTITYTKVVDDSLLTENKYIETNKAVVKLNNEVKNPETGDINIVVILVSVMSFAIISLVVLNKQKSIRYSSMVILIGICMMPIAIYAADLIKLTMNVKVEIQKGYEVGYLINSPFLLTDDELNSSIKTNDTKCIVVYLGTDKYNLCEDIIIVDDQLYSEGATVNLKPGELRIFPFAVHYNEENMELPADLCTLRSDESYVCPQHELSTNTILTWSYGLGDPLSIFTSLETDHNVMNFQNINQDSWTEDGYMSIVAPQTFTMPNHNVLFFGGIISVL